MAVDMKEIIAEAAGRLIRERKVKKLTVKDIVEECNITRQTFYYHFQDLIDVIDWSLRQAMEELVEKSIRIDSREQVIELFLSETVKARGLLRKLLASQLREQTERLIVESVRSYFREMVERRELLQDVSRSDAQVALDFYTFATVGMVLEYCSRPNLDVKRLAGQITRLMSGDALEKR